MKKLHSTVSSDVSEENVHTRAHTCTDTPSVVVPYSGASDKSLKSRFGSLGTRN